MRMKSLVIAILCVFHAGTQAYAAEVRIRIADGASGETTPAMLCILDADGKVRVPPDGRIVEEPSNSQLFFTGVPYDASEDWIGPARKMTGVGNNNDRSFVYESRPSLPYWDAPFMYQSTGNLRIELEAGTYQVVVQRGPEYVPVAEAFGVGAEAVTKRVEMRRWIDMPARGWWSGDVHVHHPSTDAVHREFLLQYAKAEDLHLVNLLEMGHHQGTDFPQAGFGKDFRVHRGDYWLVSGQEDPRSTFGHIIGLNLQSMVRDLSTYDHYDVTFRGIHAQPGALVGFAHFSWNGCDLPRGFPWYVTTGELDFVELMQFARMNGPDYYDYLNLGFRLTAAAGSDLPWGSTIGEVRTYVYTGESFDADAWFAGLAGGHSFVTNGPMLTLTVDGEIPGSELKRAAGDVVRVRAQVESHAGIGLAKRLSLVGNEGALKELEHAEGAAMLSFELRHEVTRSQWITLSAECANGALAHTSPVYISVDGKPTWSPERGPAVIARQLAAIAVIAAETDAAKGARQRGIAGRLERARAFYARMLEDMAAE